MSSTVCPAGHPLRKHGVGACLALALPGEQAWTVKDVGRVS